MSAPPTIERRLLLDAGLAAWNTTRVDVRSIRFEPGQATGLHRHPCHVIGYIAEGAAVLEVEGQPPRHLPAGALSTSRRAGRSSASTTRPPSSRFISSPPTCCGASSP